MDTKGHKGITYKMKHQMRQAMGTLPILKYPGTIPRYGKGHAMDTWDIDFKHKKNGVLDTPQYRHIPILKYHITRKLIRISQQGQRQ